MYIYIYIGFKLQRFLQVHVCSFGCLCPSPRGRHHSHPTHTPPTHHPFFNPSKETPCDYKLSYCFGGAEQ